MEQETIEIKARIAELRKRFSRLRETCGIQHISRQTLEEYAQE